MTWTLQPIASFENFAPQWDLLQARVAGLPFLESGFLLPLLASFGNGQELLAVESDGAQVTAAAILVKGGLGRWSTFQPSQLPLGAFLCESGRALEPLASELLRALPEPALVLGLTQVDSALHPRPANTARLRTQDYIETAWVDIEGAFAAYWEARGKNLRQNTRKQLKKLESLELQPRLEVLSSASAVAAVLADYGRLEAAGWKAGEGTAIAPGHPQYEFYRHMLEHFCASGRALLYRYYFNDQAVAMDLCIASGDALVILKTAYDEAHKAVSPSTLMRAEQFEALFAEGRFKRIEFFGRVMEWHTRWTEHARGIYHASLYRWAWLPALRQRLKRAPEAVPHGDGS